MRIIIVHNEADYFGGAERVMLNLIEGLQATGHSPIVMAVPGSRTADKLPVGTCFRPLPRNQPFRPWNLIKQIITVCREARHTNDTLLHGWSARDWDLVALAAKLSQRPAVGTLHDHPEAFFISRSRQRLMRWSANLGLERLACVSNAVRTACFDAGYAPRLLTPIHNGIPLDEVTARRHSPVLQLGFMGNFSAQKGLIELFQILEKFAAKHDDEWELQLAGEPQDAAGEALWKRVQTQFSKHPWWSRVNHVGWIDSPRDFLSAIDLLLFTSPQFDSLPTVLLEAAQCGTPALAARVGGVDEIVRHDQTGWLYPADDIQAGAEQLALAMKKSRHWKDMGHEAATQVTSNFSIGSMTEHYLDLYRKALRDW